MSRDLLEPRLRVRRAALPGSFILLVCGGLGAGPLLEEGPNDAGKSGAGKAAKKEGDSPGDDPADAPGKPSEGSAKRAPAPKASIDEEYVRANLEKHLRPTKIEWLPDGRVKLEFVFNRREGEDRSDIFVPTVSNSTQSVFRWSLRGEYPGSALRIAQDGMAHLNAWFTDDIEAEMWFANRTNTTTRETVALVYSSGTRSIGSNWGTQAAIFQSGKIRAARGAVESAAIRTNVKVKLLVRNGSFEAHRDGKLRETDKYPGKTFASGKLGFIWGGNVAGFIYRLEVTGRLDAKKMAEVLRKNARP